VRHSPGSLLVAAIRALRPKQWVKNGLLFAAIIFSGQFTHLDLGVRVLIGFASFCLLASAGYLLNDTLDRAADRAHPEKRRRPIASGAMPVPGAVLLIALCLVGGAALGWSLSGAFLAVALGYLTTTMSYSLYFKHVVILDVMFIAFGFLLRAVAGAVAIEVPVSEWLFLCAGMLALFIGFNKRRGELVALGDQSATRRNLAEYSLPMLDQYQAVITGAVVVCYCLYAVIGASTKWMVLTIPFVLYGIFRFIYLVDQKGEGGAPDETFLRDWPLLVTVTLYALVAMGVLQADAMGWLPPMGIEAMSAP
jgi:4-hydroxybenzoate polyprenyltransferase